MNRRALAVMAAPLMSVTVLTGCAWGQFHWVHNMAVDSAGNIYTTEVDTGKRVQKFLLKSR